MPIQFRFANAKISAGRVKKLFDDALKSKQENLPADLPKDDSSDLAAEVKYYKMLSELYEKNIDYMKVIDAYVSEQICNGRMDAGMDAEGEEGSDRIYAEMIRWLGNMEKELRHILGLPSSEVAEMFMAFRKRVMNVLEDLKSMVTDHPSQCALWVGGVAGAAVLHKYFTGICISTKVLAKIGIIKGGCGCVSVGWATAACVGAVAGLFLLMAGKCVYHHFFPGELPEPRNLRPDTQSTFEDVSQAIEALKVALNTCEHHSLVSDMRKISAYWDHFNVFDQSTDIDWCPVCLANPPVEPVLFRGCTGRHFHCFACRETCMNEGHSLCSICRQLPLVP